MMSIDSIIKDTETKITSVDSLGFEDSKFPTAKVLQSIDADTSNMINFLKNVINVSSSDNSEDGKKVNYWLAHVAPILIDEINLTAKSIKGYLSNNIVLNGLLNVLNDKELLENPEKVRYVVQNWNKIPNVLNRLESLISSDKLGYQTLDQMVKQPSVIQKTSGYFSEFKTCLGRGQKNHHHHHHHNSEILKKPSINLIYESGASLLPQLRDALYDGNFNGGLQLAGYHSKDCASDAIHGKDNKSAAIGSLVMVDRGLLLSAYFNELSQNLTHDSNYKPILNQISKSLETIGMYKAYSLASVPPVTSSQSFRL